ncbi:hypothetical protein HYZ99_05030 [Candidatus Peregrinibacteria bacterium]|nr:hypothetical protein [Candidatus Peregrinibacteria bacterium]
MDLATGTSLLFKGRYRIRTNRMKNWDYSSSACYFVTICTKGKLHWFGEIEKGKMTMSDVGKIVETYWKEIPNHFPHARLDQFVMMPDHLHGILIFDRSLVETCHGHVSKKQQTTKINGNSSNEMRDSRVSTNERRLRLVPKSLGAVINQFKMTCTKKIHAMGYDDFHWQTRFYERCLRSEGALNAIRTYIKSNVSRWKDHPDLLYISPFTE